MELTLNSVNEIKKKKQLYVQNLLWVIIILLKSRLKIIQHKKGSKVKQNLPFFLGYYQESNYLYNQLQIEREKKSISFRKKSHTQSKFHTEESKKQSIIGHENQVNHITFLLYSLSCLSPNFSSFKTPEFLPYAGYQYMNKLSFLSKTRSNQKRYFTYCSENLFVFGI